MKMMSKTFFWVSRIISVSILFFLTFWEKIFKLCLIIFYSCCLQLGKLSWPWSLWSPELFLSATLNWIYASNMGTCCCQPCNRLCNLHIWRCEGTVSLAWFWVVVGLSWSWLCSTKPCLYDAWSCEDRHIFDIWCYELCMRRLHDPISSSCGTEALLDSCWCL